MPCSAKFRNQNFQISSNFCFLIVQLCPLLYTYFPFILGKLTYHKKFWRFHHIPPSLPWCNDFVASLGMNVPIMTYFTSPTWLCLFCETPNICKSSARIESQPDWWVSHQPLRTSKLFSTTKKDSFWDLGEWRKVPWLATCPMSPSLLSASPGKDEQLLFCFSFSQQTELYWVN